MNFLSILALLLSSASGINVLNKAKTQVTATATTTAAATVKVAVAAKDYWNASSGNYTQ
jgi:hypothetical protein